MVKDAYVHDTRTPFRLLVSRYVTGELGNSAVAVSIPLPLMATSAQVDFTAR